MKILRYISLVAVAISLSTIVIGQNYPHKTITEKAQENFYERMKVYDSGILLADSLLSEYKTEPFDIAYGDGSGAYAVGSAFIRNCYARLHNLDLSDTYCLDKVAEIDEIIAAENQAENDMLYQKIIDKADKYYDANNFPKALELYERAVTFRPDDANVQTKLEAAKSKLD